MIIAESMGFGSNFGIKGELKETDAKAACVCVCIYLCVHVCVCVCVCMGHSERRMHCPSTRMAE